MADTRVPLHGLALVFVLALVSGSVRAQEALDDAPASGNLTPLTRVRATQVLSHEEMHRWDRHVRGFRREHNFALSSGVSSGTWKVKRLGSIEDRNFDNSGVYSRFQYSFHLPVYKGFGYLLGSSAGYHYESADRRRPFRPVDCWQYPGLLAGVVLNISPVLRWSIAFDTYLERHNGIEERDGVGEDTKIFVTLQAYDAGTYFDVFYDLSWALRLEAHMRHLEYQRPKIPTDSEETFPVDANLKKDDQWLGIGLVFHLL